MKRLWTKLPAVLVACMVVALIAYGFWPRAISVDAVPVVKGSLRVTVDDDGETRIREKYVISAPLTGQLVRLQLHPGDAVVQAETVVARIFPTEPSLLDERTRAEFEARAKAADAAKQQATASLASARELSELAEHRLKRVSQLVGKKATTRQEMDEAEHHAAVAKANIRAAEFAVKVRSFEYEQAEAALQRVRGSSSETDNQAMAITAPENGKILRVFHEDASVVTAGTALVEIGDVSDLEMVFDIVSSEAARIKPGANIEIDHWGGDKPLKGTVRRVEPSAFLKVSALGVEEKRVNVIADFVDPVESRRNLGDGFRIEAKITVLETPADSLKVSAGALFRHGDRWHAYRIKNGAAVLTAVDVGASNGIETEIVSGLAESDLVILHPTDQVGPGTRVIPTVMK